MNVDTILRLLRNAGFRVLGTDGVYINLEDPTCILRSFETFLDYAWVAIAFITGIFLFGFAVYLLRGVKKDYFITLRNLTIIFGTLTAVKPAINLIFGADVFSKGCKTVRVSIADVQKILGARGSEFEKRAGEFEEFDIADSGAGENSDALIESLSSVPFSEMPAAAPTKTASAPVWGVQSKYNGDDWGKQCTPEKRSSVFVSGKFTTGQFSSADPAFDKALNVVFRTEGGYVNDPYDSGGETKYGISKNNNPDVDVKNLSREGAEKIAYDKYYKKYGIDKLPDGIRGEVFQVGWACGPTVAIKQLQKTLGVSRTGKIDDATLIAAQNYSGELRNPYIAEHREYLKAIVARKPSQKKFIRGWMNRADLITENGCFN